MQTNGMEPNNEKSSGPTVDELIDAAKSMKTLRKKTSGWRWKLCMRDQQNKCYWCNAELDPETRNRISGPHVDHLIRPDAGGAQMGVNLVGTCMKCNRTKSTQDPLAWCLKHPEKLERRTASLRQAHNHLTRVVYKDRTTCKKYIAKRFAHQRFPVMAWHGVEAGYILWSTYDGLPSHVPLLIKSHGAVIEKHGVWHVARLGPDRFLDCVWTLVELNAFVRKLDMPHTQWAAPGSIEDIRWSETHTDFTVLALRRARKGWG